MKIKQTRILENNVRGALDRFDAIRNSATMREIGRQVAERYPKLAEDEQVLVGVIVATLMLAEK